MEKEIYDFERKTSKEKMGNLTLIPIWQSRESKL